MRVKQYTDIELRQCFSLTHGPLMSLRYVQNTIQTLSWDNPSDSLMVPWCRLNACKTHYTFTWDNPSASFMVLWSRSNTCNKQYKHWVETITQPHSWYPDDVAQIRVKHKKHWVETIPRPHLWYPDVAQMRVKHNTDIELRQSLGLTYGTLMSLKRV